MSSSGWTTESGGQGAHAQGTEPDFDSDDPYQVLGMGRTPTTDPKVIKRAYKKLALRYHPDVSTDTDKKRASDRFAKINWAYQTLSGKLRDQATSGSSSSRSSTTASSGGGWTPPHRRATASTTGASGAGARTSRTGEPSVDWRDYMPRYDEEDAMYDAGGDSLGAIFRDLVVGAASGGRGVLKDFVDFLEQNVDGYGGGSSSLDGDDAELKVLLRTGTLGDIGDEMDTTELVVNQLTEKLRQLDQEVVLLTAEAKVAAKYMDKLQIEERLEEIKARRKVVDGYIGKARKRLLALQTRYKEMITAGDNDPKAGGRTDSRVPSSSSSPYQTTTTTTSTSPPTDYASASQRPRHDKPEDSWKDDSFGSFGRGRGSSRRHRTGQPQSTVSSSSTPSAGSSYSTGPSSSSAGTSSSTSSGSYRSATNSAAAAATKTTRAIPPQSVGPYSYEEDKRRLRDLKVDEEFDKLKKELGL
jgi:DnaJ domain